MGQISDYLRQVAPDADQDFDTPCYSMAVGPGWWPILERLHADAVALDPEYSVDQIKEKFGGLRAYLNSDNGDVHELAWAAEKESESVCEDCGGAGTIQPSPINSFWLRCLCDACIGRLS